jgi:hypothetical protein
MNVARHLNGSRARECDRAGRPFRIAAEVEALGTGGRGEREDVVIDVILVREVNCRALNDRQDVWDEALVALGHAPVSPFLEPGWWRIELFRIAFEVEDDIVQLRDGRVARRRRRDGSHPGIGVNPKSGTAR